MNPWTALLESLHSSLIDELTERHPEPKPTLGLPVRQSRLELPKSSVSALVCEFCFGEARGFALLAFDEAFMKTIGLAPEDFWKLLTRRAGSEFMRRGIQPVSGGTRVLKDLGSELPQGLKGFVEPTRAVWIPFQIPSGSCFLGLAV